jgi:hypothetical protein
VKLSSAAPLDVVAVNVAEHSDPPRIQIRFGPLRLTLSETEAVTIARGLVDAIGQLRAGQPPTDTA